MHIKAQMYSTIRVYANLHIIQIYKNMPRKTVWPDSEATTFIGKASS